MPAAVENTDQALGVGEEQASPAAPVPSGPVPADPAPAPAPAPGPAPDPAPTGELPAAAAAAAAVQWTVGKVFWVGGLVGEFLLHTLHSPTHSASPTPPPSPLGLRPPVSGPVLRGRSGR